MSEKEINGFIQYSRTWHGKMSIEAGHHYLYERVIEEIWIRIGANKGESGSRYEFVVRWHDFLTKDSAIPSLEIFDDAWDAFEEVPQIFKLLFTYSTSWPNKTKKKPLTPQQLCEGLKGLGLIDLTEEIRGKGPIGLK